MIFFRIKIKINYKVKKMNKKFKLKINQIVIIVFKRKIN